MTPNKSELPKMFRYIKKTALLFLAVLLPVNNFAGEAKMVSSFLGPVWNYYTLLPLDQSEREPAFQYTVLHTSADGQYFFGVPTLPWQEFTEGSFYSVPMTTVLQFHSQASSQNCALLHQIPASIQLGSLMLLMHQASLLEISYSPLQVSTSFHNGCYAMTLIISDQGHQLQVFTIVDHLGGRSYDVITEMTYQNHSQVATRPVKKRYNMQFGLKQYRPRKTCRPPSPARPDPRDKDDDSDQGRPGSLLSALLQYCCVAATSDQQRQVSEQTRLINSNQSAYSLPPVARLQQPRIGTSFIYPQHWQEPVSAY